MGKLHISVAAEVLTHIGPLPITNSLLTSMIVMILLFALALWVEISPVKKGVKQIPTPVLMVTEGFYNFLHGILGALTDKLFPIAFTFFLFIILGNWIGLLPGVGPIGINESIDGEKVLIPLFRGPNADLSTTVAFALISVGVTQYFGVKALGFKGYFQKFINFKNPMNFVLGILETIQEFSKIISFSFRLFGNIFAGEVLLTVIAFLVPFLMPVPFLALEVFVGFIQALVFTVLTAIFIAVATESAHN